MALNRTESIAIEIELLHLAGKGQEIALKRLYTLWSSKLMGMSVSLLSDRELAEEVVQDAFVQIWKHASRYDSDLSRPFSWAVTITRRIAYGKMRQQSRRGGKIINMEIDEERIASDQNVQAFAEKHDSLEKICSLINQYPEDQRNCMRLAFFKGYRYREIAEKLELPLGSVKTWIRRGLLELRKQYLGASI